MPEFDIDSEPALKKFIEHLGEWDGKGRGTPAARGIAHDIGKVLKYISPTKASFFALTDTDAVKRYLEYIKKETHILAHGLCTKLSNIISALKYMRVRLCKTQEERVPVAEALLRCEMWMPVLRKEKAYLTAVTQQEQGDGGELLQVQQFLTGKVTKQATDPLVKAIHRPLTTGEERVVVGVLLGTMIYSNFQRPGAATTATLEEFNQALPVEGSMEGVCYVMRVKRHKTMKEGPAQMVLSQADRNILKKYVARVHNIHETALDSQELLLYSGKPIKTPTYFIQKAAEACGVAAPTPTAVRKAAETKGLQTLSTPAHSLLSAHMGHGTVSSPSNEGQLSTTLIFATIATANCRAAWIPV